MADARGLPFPAWMYWLVVAGLVGFGIVGLLSIGWPFLLTGLGLAFLAPFRRRPMIFWPVLGGWIAAVLTWFLLTPWGCTATIAPPATGVEMVECRNLLGMRLIRGQGVPEAGFLWWSSALAAVGVGVAAWAALRRIVAQRGRSNGGRRLGRTLPRSES